MKSIRYILTAIISLTAWCSACACGPYAFQYPNPTFFRIPVDKSTVDRVEENLRLWQSQTSSQVKLEDIREVIYGDDWNSTELWMNKTDNTFLNYIKITEDYEAIYFINLAKEVEELREDRNSPWYYPSMRYYQSGEGFENLIEDIYQYKGERFRNRYSLQLIRILFTCSRYEECIKAFNERFDGVPDSDLMKQMSADYVAGAAVRLGNGDLGRNYLISTGDVESLGRFFDYSMEDAFKLAAEGNPSSPKLMKFIEGKINKDCSSYDYDSDLFFSAHVIGPVAETLSKRRSTPNRAVWSYISAICKGEFKLDFRDAYTDICRANRLSAGLPVAENIRAYKMLLEAELGIRSNLLSDLQWLESKIANFTDVDASYWNDVLQNIVLDILIKQYDRDGDAVTALQLANFADNLLLGIISQNSDVESACIYPGYTIGGVKNARKAPKVWNNYDFRSTFFQYLTSQTSATIRRYISSLDDASPLAAFLNSRSYTNRDYLYDALGTICLRERNYASAVAALSRVSKGYQALLNTDRDGYLRHNPFIYVPDWLDDGNVKLNFAQEMLRLERKIASSTNPDVRGRAKLEYSIGLERSFTSCWALTAYYKGECMSLPEDRFDEWMKRPYNYEDLCVRAEDDARKMREEALAEITDPEILAWYHRAFGNYRTVARCYPNTIVGREMGACCDSWFDWRR